MSLRSRARSFLSAQLRPRRWEREMEEEWRLHLAARADDLMAGGMPGRDAEQRARLEFGDPLRWREQSRDARGLRAIAEVRQDAAYAIRQMRRAPGFTLAVVTTLALGIGANTAIFSVVNAVLLRPLPYPDSHRLVSIVEHVPAADASSAPRRRAVGVALSDLGALRAQATALSHVGVYAGATVLVTGRAEALRLDMARTSPAVFEMIRAWPLIGRVFEPRDETPGHDDVVVLSHAAWQRLFAGAADVLDHRLTLDGRSYAVIGVMPPEFRFPDAQTQAWIPYALGGSSLRARVPPMARLADGVSIDAATAQVSAVLRNLLTTADPVPGAAPLFELVRVHDQLTESVRPALLVLAGAVGFVLLIACVNVANLLMARTASRERELAVRRALGAGRARLLRQLLTESLCLALLAAAAGIAMGYGGLHLLRTAGATLARRDLAAEPSIPRLDEVSIDGAALTLAVAAALVTGAVAGLAPALGILRARHHEALGHGTGSAHGGFDLRRRRPTRGLLVVAEVAMAMVLLVGGGLLMHSFSRLSSVDPGFDPEGVLTFNVYSTGFRSLFGPNPPTAAESQRPAEFAEALLSRLEAFPAVTAAGYTELLPLVRFRVGVRLRLGPETSARPPAPPAPGASLSPETPDMRVVSHGFLTAMGMRVIAGRGFRETDGAGRPQVMLINRALARSGVLGANPLGARVYAAGDRPWEVVGIVEDVRQYGLSHEPDPQVFVDVRQVPSGNPNVYFVVRAAGDPRALVPAIRTAAAQLEPGAIVDNVATMEEIVSSTMARPRLYAVLLALLAAVAVTLAAVGMYGVLAYAVVQRTREIGVRMALGAERSRVIRLVVGQSVVVTLIGIALGLAGAAILSRWLEGLLFELAPVDPATYSAATLAFVAIAAVAAFVPARRATRVDPLAALRCE